MSLSDTEIEIRKNYQRRIRIIKNEYNKKYAGNASKIPYSRAKLPSQLPTINAEVTIKLSERTCQELKDLVCEVYYSGSGGNGLTYDQLIKHLIQLIREKVYKDPVMEL